MEHTEYVDLGRFETYIHYHFKDKHLLLEALSHSCLLYTSPSPRDTR